MPACRLWVWAKGIRRGCNKCAPRNDAIDRRKKTVDCDADCDSDCESDRARLSLSQKKSARVCVCSSVFVYACLCAHAEIAVEKRKKSVQELERRK